MIIRDYRRKRTFLLDLKVPYDSLSNFSNSRAANYAKYKHLVTDIHQASRHDVTLYAIIVGSWDPLNESVLQQLGLTLGGKGIAYDVPDAHFRRGRSSCDPISLIEIAKSLTYRTYLALSHSHSVFVYFEYINVFIVYIFLCSEKSGHTIIFLGATL